MWVLLDNYDSFSHILHHHLLLSGHECIVFRNDELSIPVLAAMNPKRLIISPGPQTPKEAGISLAAIEYFHNRIPILGICLGHQALGVFFEGQLKHNPKPMHGKTSLIQHNGHPLFHSIPDQFEVMRYHSLCIEIPEYNPHLLALAKATDDNVLMALTHKNLPLMGLQFHPESIGTEYGQAIIDNWAKMNL
ncbi:MAG: aminodeoxychorismate/anthranilate synthase component II [Phycisphaerales bacterium]|nr:aminodeoxychorismate/anthranilate synthase component II [Phycisphaerales bacterium]